MQLPGAGLLLSWFDNGFAVLVVRDGNGERRLAEGYSRFRQLAGDARHYYWIAATPEQGSVVLAIDRDNHECRVLVGAAAALPTSEVSRPQTLRFASGGEDCHGFFYPPHNGGYRSPSGEKPPLLVFLHGSPTSACYPIFDPRIQFWTQRGFAVADLNYRGSTGYGRAYRLRLHGEWGDVEIEDACALAFSRIFRGGASLYGVSDPLRDAERYAARTPLLHADKIEAPVIFFQGGQDAVVLPAQTESMVAALRARGLAVEYHLYPEERHGFRRAGNQAHALEHEWRFYQRLLTTPE